MEREDLTVPFCPYTCFNRCANELTGGLPATPTISAQSLPEVHHLTLVKQLSPVQIQPVRLPSSASWEHVSNPV